MGEWIEHDGGVCPLTHGQRYQVRRRNGVIHDFVCDDSDFHPRPGSWSCWEWASRPLMPPDFIAYRVIDPFRAQRQSVFESWLNVPAPEIEPA